MMNEQPPPPGLVGAATDLGRRLIGSLPPAFIMLLLINTIFLGLVFWFVDVQLEQRTALANRVLDACLLKVGQ